MNVMNLNNRIKWQILSNAHSETASPHYSFFKQVDPMMWHMLKAWSRELNNGMKIDIHHKLIQYDFTTKN